MFDRSDDEVLLEPAAYPEFGVLDAAIDRRDWASCRAVLDAVPLSGRSMFLRYAAEKPGLEEWLRHLLQADPWDSTASALLGMHLTDIGWKIRSSLRAEHVSAAQFEQFHAWLRRAEAVLIDGAARAPYDPAIWSARLTTARGLQMEPAEERRRYDRMAAADPHHVNGQRQYLNSLLPKWGGSWPQAHAFAREVMMAAPPGAHQGALVAEVHVEQWLDLGGEHEKAAAAHLTGARDTLYEAANRSIWHADFRRDPGWVSVASTFAMVFAEMSDQEPAARVFAMLGPMASRWPWYYYDGHDELAVIRRHRRRSASALTGGRR
ncbi:hypothetical protein Q0Z83_033990 [Actinoplanes sichuanensis]|uniref:DUF4034 domain-containing protein n=1 Tax=Actinoplanes sichuanensis TaxID=512349 RepID=A0ABW4ATB9_9ACTN|nr:hypothetical protein [Actinoplanes sichuanensis]BEL05208.1 hypothetical protein Q0Z83_033990 [Actinoplanes sichuanensis]